MDIMTAMNERTDKRKATRPRGMLLLLCGLAGAAAITTAAAEVGVEANTDQPPFNIAEQALLDLTVARETLLPAPGSRASNRGARDMRGRPIDIVGQHNWRMQQQLRRQGLRGVPVIEVR
ncbi:MAG: hypothetical protein HKO62_03485 [Gammaproteobacteria bacterium]|nr:hypothetical protein [Gammaproteobacteria bacterium]